MWRDLYLERRMTREGGIRFRVRCSGYGVISSLWSDDPLAFLVPSLIRAPVSADEDVVDNVLVLVSSASILGWLTYAYTQVFDLSLPLGFWPSNALLLSSIASPFCIPPLSCKCSLTRLRRFGSMQNSIRYLLHYDSIRIVSHTI